MLADSIFLFLSNCACTAVYILVHVDPIVQTVLTAILFLCKYAQT